MSWLKLQLEQRPRIQSLTRNPLLLTFMVILAGKDPHSEFPSQRAAFYRRYVEDLLDSWETYRRPQSGPEGEQVFRLGPFTGDRARLAAREGFYYLGWYLHLAYYGGRGEGTRLNRHDVVAVLARYYKDCSAYDLPPDDLHILAEDALEVWLEAGILDVWHIEGEDYLAFRHMTFQEYAVAYMLAEAWKKTPQYTWVHTLRPILHHYAWREPILLLAGLLDTRHLNDLVHHLLRGPSPYERYLHRDLRLAAALLGEGVASDTMLAARLIDHLGGLIRNHTAVWKMRLTWLTTCLVGGVAIWRSLLLGDIILWGTLSSWWLYGGILFWTLAWVCAFVKPIFPKIQTYLALPSRMLWGTSRPEPFIQALSDLGAPQSRPSSRPWAIAIGRCAELL